MSSFGKKGGLKMPLVFRLISFDFAWQICKIHAIMIFFIIKIILYLNNILI